MSTLRSRPLLVALCLLALAQHAPAAARWIATVDDGSGLPTLEAAGGPALGSSLAFWSANGAAAQVLTRVSGPKPGAYEAASKVEALGVTVLGTTVAQARGGWTSELRLQDDGRRAGPVAGGMVFRFDLGDWAGTMAEPTLLPDGRGWQWGRAGGPQATMRFDPPPAALEFVKGGKSELRVLFFKGALPAGGLHVRLTLEVGGGVLTMPAASERYGAAPPSTWPTEPPDGGPDLAFLNAADKPAGRRGPVHVERGALVYADGTPARFWGTNIAAYALFATPRAEVRAQARRLAQQGYNLVRIHHFDSPWVSPGIFGRYADIADTGRLDPQALDALDWWIKCLKDEGVHVWLDLHVQRAFKAGDHIDGFDEMRAGKDSADLKGFNYVNATIEQAMMRFNAAYLGHVNAYTGLATKDDPAVVAVLLTNENDLTQHFANRLLPDKNVPLHNKRYMAEADAFARSSGLSARGLWHSWEPGAPKLFLNDLEHRFDIAMMADLRRQGVKTPVATTSAWGAEPVSALPALTTGDLVDAHSYGGAGALERNPRFLPNIVDWPAAAHVPGVPLSVSEWNAEPFPTPDRHVLPLYVAATAAHQGWDALMHYAYAQEAFARNSPSNWNAYNDPSLLAMMPAAALLYRERHVAEATTTYVFDPGADAFFGSALSPASSVALRTAAERGKLLVAMPRTPALPWLRHWPWPKGAVAIHDPDQSLLPPDATSARSDSGELVRNWDEGVFTISTPRTQAALGWIGGRVIALPNVTFNLLTPNASVAVQSLDGAALAASSDLLVSVGTRSQPQPGWSAPFLVEPAAGSLVIRARPGLLACVDGAAGKLVPWPLRYADGAYTLQFDAKTIVHWFYLRPAGADNGSCRPGPSAQPGGR